VVAAAGNLEHTALVRLVRRALAAGRLALVPDAHPAPPRCTATPVNRSRPRPGVHVLERATEQANLVLGVPGLPRDDRRWTLALLSSVLGDGSSSRLFQSVREERGLAYAVSSYFTSLTDVGEFGVYVGCHPAKVDEVVRVVRGEIDGLLTSGVTDAELARAKGQLRGSLLLGLEDTGSRMTRLAKADLLSGELPSLSEVLRRIEGVTRDDVHALASELFAAPLALSVVGPFDDDEPFRRAVA
jgi:predicted Zn-dependent peptidase